MGKAKKGKRGGKDEDFDDDVEVPQTEVPVEEKGKGKNKKGKDEVKEEEVEEEQPKSKGKKKKGKKGAALSDDEDIGAAVEEPPKPVTTSSGGFFEFEELPDEDDEEDYAPKKRKGKKKGGDKPVVEEKTEDVDDGEEGGTVKTAAQKKKEKKEREKQRKMANKEGQAKPEVKEDEEEEPEPVKEPKKEPKEAKGPKGKQSKKAVESEESADENERDSKKKKNKKEADKPAKPDKKGPGKKTLSAMQEALRILKEKKEQEEREEAERIRKEEEEEAARLEALRIEQEKKALKKQREKERKERLKAEGKLLTPKQRAQQARAQAMLDAFKAQGVELPGVGEKKAPRPGTRIRPSKLKQQTSTDNTEEEPKKESESETAQSETVHVEIVDQNKDKEEAAQVTEATEDNVKDSWDAESSDDEEDKSEETKKEEKKEVEEEAAKESSEEESSEEEEEDSEDSDSSDDDDDDDGKTDAELKREKALARIQKRREEAEKKKTVEDLRAAVICVLGHVDTGKTKILDKLRKTNVQDGEAGGITQQIGATNVPIDAIREETKWVKGFADKELKLPGLLIIDTPGHESFSNLRSRGSSLCDMAILVVDIMHALEPQTIESLNLLKNRKTPFVVALNKIDRLYDWETMSKTDVRDIIKAQAPNTQLEFEQRTKEVILQFAEQGLNSALFYENPDPRTYVSLVPTSAITGEGMGNLLALIVESCQTLLAKRLMYSEELQATVLEVKAIPGFGTTIDAIVVNGRLREGDTMIVAGTDGPIVTQIRSLVMPQPMKELRVKNAYVEHKEVKAAQGVKIAAKELEKAIAGLNIQVAQKPDEIDILKEEVARELKSALSHVKLSERGVYVQASTLGSLEALLEFLRSSKIPYANIRIGPVVRRDVMIASTMLEHDSQYAVILAFDVKVERDAQEMADSMGVKIFQADIIYHLFDKFMAYREELKQRKRDEFKSIAVFPCKLKIMPQYVFNSRDPIVVGVMVEAGIIKEGTPICVPSKEFIDLGIITSVEVNHKAVENARKGQEVCIKIEPVPGEAPKMFGRHFDETDMLVSKISRQSIDACKDYFRDDLTKTDWQLMVELKKVFEIL